MCPNGFSASSSNLAAHTNNWQNVTNGLVRSEFHEDNIMRPIRRGGWEEQQSSWDWYMGNDRCGVSWHATNGLFHLEYYCESVDALVTVLMCAPLLGTPSSATVQKLRLTSCCRVWPAPSAGATCLVHEVHYCDTRIYARSFLCTCNIFCAKL